MNYSSKCVTCKDLFIKNRSKHSSNTLQSLLRFFMNKSLSNFFLKWQCVTGNYYWFAEMSCTRLCLVGVGIV